MVTEHTNSTAAASLRVLVVEDGQLHQKLAEGLLKRRGCDVTISEDGAEALQLVKSRVFDVVLMDVEMPVMDGLTATLLIRQYEHALGRHTPVVAVTTLDEPERCLEAGMDAYLAKPLRADTLHQTLEAVLPAS